MHPDPQPTPHSESDLDFGPTQRGLRTGMKVLSLYQLIRELGRECVVLLVVCT
jgi:hypothetical protein